MEPYATALVLGLAASGEAAARLLLAEGTQVRILDRSAGDDVRRRAAALEALGAEVRLGQSEVPPDPYSVCVVSPGIPVNSAWVNAVRSRGIPVLSELELGWSRACQPTCLPSHSLSDGWSAVALSAVEGARAEAFGRRGASSRVLAISGSNGKSTLVKLCAEALACAGRRVAIAGNYGPPVSQVVKERRNVDWLVLEVSSFQLETVRAFRPEIAVLLNLFPNHLDRHGTMAAYERLKASLFSRMRPEDIGVVPEGVAAKITRLAASPNRWVTFGLLPEADVRYQDGCVTERLSSRVLWLKDTVFANDVLGVAAAAAAAALSACGEPLDALARAARAFESLPHRMQEVARHRQVRFVNDSKATNLAAMMAALTMSSKPVHLIAGGLPKHESYDQARSLLAEKVAAVYLVGTAAEAMASAWQAVVPCRRCRTLDQAVASAWSQARPGDTILLSPACASLDQFQSFEERGNRFAELVRSLKEDKTTLDKTGTLANNQC